MGKIQKQLLISGRVQGVGFRHFTKQNARDLGVNGWVKNLRNGDVEAVLEGEEEQVDELGNRLKSGPVAAKVKSVDVVKIENVTEDSFKYFSVKH